MIRLSSIPMLWFMAAATAAQPATRPDLTAVLALLPSTDPATRAAAQQMLLGLSVDDLPALREALRTTNLNQPEMLSAVKTAVMHIKASALSYTRVPNTSFLGVNLSRSIVPVTPDGSTLGICILSRQLGFKAFHYLRDGDYVVAVNSQPLESGTSENFARRIRSHPPGTPISLTVLRNGETLTVNFIADYRPAEIEALGQDRTFFAERLALVEAYWSQEFLPSLKVP